MKDAYLSALGRLLVSVLFIGSGLSKIGAPDATMGYIASVGLPLASMVYGITVLVEVGGGLLLLVGFQTHLTAAILALFTLAAGFIFHSHFADQNQTIHFMKNLAITGGLLQVVALGAGGLSLDARRRPSVQYR